ncbi:MKRN2 opposite strand protein-like isoform X2 [Amphiura filiformis]|uniref:MKRN2 opposite strand protein-like isoform X2 n=1 Tax=Amphiura filiformis TaxID=82378 RepID=UPI003B2150B8
METSHQAHCTSDEQHMISFRHCHPRNASILCFQVPDQCPLCQTRLSSVRLPSPPVRYPSVFVSSSVAPCSIIIKPTVGTFLNDYKDGANLHAGITNTKGSVYGYDENGVQVSGGRLSWKQCVTVSLIDQYDDDIKEGWDKGLQEMAGNACWTKEKYHESLHNCFDFVVGFLNHVHYNQMKWNKPDDITRNKVCHEYIVPLTTRASKYISVYRCVQQQGFIIKE